MLRGGGGGGQTMKKKNSHCGYEEKMQELQR